MTEARKIVAFVSALRKQGDGDANLLHGGDGDDILIGGAGDDILIGGGGANLERSWTSFPVEPKTGSALTWTGLFQL